MKLVGLTGGIGAGKSIVGQLFRILGVPVYDSDSEAKRIMLEDAFVRKELIELFGARAYLKSGHLNRRHLSKKVFTDPLLLKKMNAIVHPAVRSDFINWSSQWLDKPYIIQESALLYEIGAQSFFDAIIVVDAPEELRIKRVMMRDLVSREDVMNRIDNQMPAREKAEKADYLVPNDGKRSIIKAVLDIHKVLVDSE